MPAEICPAGILQLTCKYLLRIDASNQLLATKLRVWKQSPEKLTNPSRKLGLVKCVPMIKDIHIVSTLDNTVDDTSWAGTGVIMPFGKHAGRPLSEIPPQYLRWLYSNCDFTYFPELQIAVEHRLGLPPDPVIRGGPPKEGNGPQKEATTGPTSGTCARRRETGLDLFRRSFTDCRNSILVQYQEDDAAFDFATGILDRVQRALGI